MLFTENQSRTPTFDNLFADTLFVTVPWRGRRLLWMGIVMLVAVSIGAGLLALLLMPEMLSGAVSTPTTVFSVAILALQAVVMLICIYLFGMLPQRLGWRELGFTSFPRSWLWKAIGLTLLLRIGVGLIAWAMMQVGIVSQQPQAMAPEGFSWLGAVGMMIFAGIAVPIAEEIFFRGMLYRWMRTRWSVWLSTIISSLLFALSHVEPATVIPVIGMGIVLAQSYERSRSLWVPVLIHAFNNLIVIGLLYAFLAAGIPIPGING